MLSMRALSLVSVATFVAILAACSTPPKPPLPEAEMTGGPTEDFEALRTPQVTVGPVTGSPAAPHAVVRAAFYRELIERSYAPVRLDLTGAEIPDGVGRVKVSISLWDRSEVRSRSVILVSGEASFNVDGRAIWSASFADIAVRCRSSSETRDAEQMDIRAAAGVATRVLRSLPVKR